MSDDRKVTHLRVVEAGEGFHADVDQILQAATGQGMSDVLICGYLPDGSMWLSSSCGDGETLMLMERAKFMMMHASLEIE